MSGTIPLSVTLNSQLTAAYAAYATAGSLVAATADQLASMLALFQTALGTAQTLQTNINTAFDANNGDHLFASGVDPTTMAASLVMLQEIAAAMVYIDNIVNRVSRTIALIELAQQGQT